MKGQSSTQRMRFLRLIACWKCPTVARGRGFANLLFTQLCWRLTRSALLCYSDGYFS